MYNIKYKLSITYLRKSNMNQQDIHRNDKASSWQKNGDNYLFENGTANHASVFLLMGNTIYRSRMDWLHLIIIYHFLWMNRLYNRINGQLPIQPIIQFKHRIWGSLFSVRPIWMWQGKHVKTPALNSSWDSWMLNTGRGYLTRF